MNEHTRAQHLSTVDYDEKKVKPLLDLRNDVVKTERNLKTSSKQAQKLLPSPVSCCHHHSSSTARREMATPDRKIIHAKLVILGDIGTGKTSLVLRFVKGQYFTDQEPTIGAAFFTQILSLNEATVKFDIWDTAGQERYHSLAPMYYRNAAVALVVYDISDMATFTRAKKWVHELQNQGSSSVAVMALVGNKVDLESKREVPIEEADSFARESGLFFIETSAKTAQNINELFYEVAKRLASCGRYPLQPSGTNVLLSELQNSRRRSRCCT